MFTNTVQCRHGIYRSISHCKRDYLLQLNTNPYPDTTPLQIYRADTHIATLYPHKTLRGYRVITKLMGGYDND